MIRWKRIELDLDWWGPNIEFLLMDESRTWGGIEHHIGPGWLWWVNGKVSTPAPNERMARLSVIKHLASIKLGLIDEVDY